MTEHGTLEHELRGTDEAALPEFLRSWSRSRHCSPSSKRVAGGLLRDGSMLPTIVLLPLMALAVAFSFIGARRPSTCCSVWRSCG